MQQLQVHEKWSLVSVEVSESDVNVGAQIEWQCKYLIWWLQLLQSEIKFLSVSPKCYSLRSAT